MIKVLVGALLLSLPTYGQETSDIPMAINKPQASAMLSVQDGAIRSVQGDIYEVHGGVYLTQDAALAIGKEVRKLEAENEAMKNAPGISPQALMLTAVVCILVGGATAWMLKR